MDFYVFKAIFFHLFIFIIIIIQHSGNNLQIRVDGKGSVPQVLNNILVSLCHHTGTTEVSLTLYRTF